MDVKEADPLQVAYFSFPRGWNFLASTAAAAISLDLATLYSSVQGRIFQYTTRLLHSRTRL